MLPPIAPLVCTVYAKGSERGVYETYKKEETHSRSAPYSGAVNDRVALESNVRVRFGESMYRLAGLAWAIVTCDIVPFLFAQVRF